MLLPLPPQNPEGSELVPFDDGAGEKWQHNALGKLANPDPSDGRTFGQQRAILRYLAKTIQHNGKPLYPENPEDALLVDGFLDVLEDIWPVLADTCEPTKRPCFFRPCWAWACRNNSLLNQSEKTSGPLAMKFDH